jgi:ferredoxin
MRVEVESTRCQGHTLCAMVAPGSFVLDDVDGHADVVSGEVSAAEHDRVLEAVRSCPEKAVRVIMSIGDRR